MQDETAILYGQIETSLGLAELCDALAEFGIAAHIGESSHYAGGCYLRVARGDAEMTLEKIGADECLVRGEAPFLAAMSDLAMCASAALGRAKLKHRLEIYFLPESSALLGYFHCDWPRNQQLT